MSKTIIITGASSGIGEFTAKFLAKTGAINVILGARREEKLKEIVAAIRNDCGEAHFLKTDVTKYEDLKALAEYAILKTGRIDAIIVNAGVMSVAPMNMLPIKEWEVMIDVNIKGLLYSIAAVLPFFERQRSGHFIAIGSVAGTKVASPGSTVYSGTKFSVRAIMEGLRHEVGEGIRTTLISPGAIESELILGSSHLESRERVAAIYNKIAIHPRCVAEAIQFALSRDDDFDINEIILRPTVQEF
jgi:NADP-dependent 3-hydroxy acid dehydrogenase YdfG